MLVYIIKKYKRLSAIQIIQNAVSSRPNYERDRKYDRFREDYPNLKERLLLLYQGYVAEERNLETAIRAMCAAREHRWVLLIMGYGDYDLTLKRLAHDLKAHDRVLFVPPKTQDILLEYTASADLGLIPYPTNADINTRYVSPNKLYEFIAAGIPILSNKLPYVRHVIEENGYGLVAELDTCEGFGAAIAAIRTNQLQTYRDNIRHTGSKYSWNEEKRNLLNMYRELVQ
jgi:glycosyltransferase involved in cell wall biosynthesis